jgi:cell division protein FtsX
MEKRKTNISAFEIMVLFVGFGVVILGFNLINKVYKANYEMGWLMVIAIFLWLMLLTQFILLSINVDSTKNILNEIKDIKETIKKNKKKK